MSWLSGLPATRQPEALRQGAGLGLGGEPSQRKAQEAELLGRGREQEVALVPGRRRRRGAVRGLTRPSMPPDVMARGHAIGLELPRRPEQVAELHPLVAADTGHRRRAREIGVGEIIHHARPKARSHSPARNAESRWPRPPAARRGCRARRSRRPCLRQRCPMVVELQRDADHVVALLDASSAAVARSCPPRPTSRRRRACARAVPRSRAGFEGCRCRRALRTLLEYQWIAGRILRSVPASFHLGERPEGHPLAVASWGWGPCISRKWKGHAPRRCPMGGS